MDNESINCEVVESDEKNNVCSTRNVLFALY